MNDKVAKVCLCIIAGMAIVGSVIVSMYTSSAVATALIQLAGVCVGAIGGVAVQGALSNKNASLCQPTVSDSGNLPDVI